MEKIINVNIEWVDEDRAYMATSCDVKGFGMESNSLDVLIDRCRVIISDMLEIDEFTLEYHFKENVNFNGAVGNNV